MQQLPKPTPPQQSSLTEMWGGRTNQKATTKSEQNIDHQNPIEGLRHVKYLLLNLTEVGECSKRKELIPTAEGMGLANYLFDCPHAVIDHVRSKRRKLEDTTSTHCSE